MVDVASYESDSDGAPQSKERTPAGWKRHWQRELAAAQKRLNKFHTQGVKVNERFLNEQPGTDNIDCRLPLYHSNVTTLCSMLYGQEPKAEVSREHHDPDDDIARVSCLLFQRMLEMRSEPSGSDLKTVLESALQDRLLPGLGVARVRYEFEEAEVDQLDPLTGGSRKVTVLASESAPIDYVHWQDYLWGWARTFNEIPWMAFRVWMDKDDAEKRFGKKKAAMLEYKAQTSAPSDEQVDDDTKSHIEKAEIWEIWNKRDKRVYWYNTGPDLILDSQDDPLRLDGFWPVPRPMMANTTTSNFIPKADFVINQDLYNQIDELNTRINTITRAIKVVGVYDQSAEGVRRMLVEGVENDLIPVDNWAMFAEKGGLKGTIDWFPVQDVVGVLQTLQSVMDRTIDFLWQITGMSDILRGANTDQYVSDGTNQLTAKFGSIRVQRLQDDFARFASDLESLKAEVISKHFSIRSIAMQSSAEYLPAPDRPKAGPAIELMKSPTVKWRVNIRPETVAMVDYAQLRQERTEFLTAMATYIQSAQAAVKQMPGSLPVLMEMLKWGMAGFKGAGYLEGIMDQAIEMAKQAPPQDDSDGRAEAEKVKQQGELQKIQATIAGDMQKITAKAQADQQVINMKFQAEMQRDAAKHQQKLSQDMSAMRAEMTKIQENLAADLKVIATKLGADLAVEKAQSSYAMVEREAEHEQAMDEIEEQRENTRGEDD